MTNASSQILLGCTVYGSHLPSTYKVFIRYYRNLQRYYDRGLIGVLETSNYVKNGGDIL